MASIHRSAFTRQIHNHPFTLALLVSTLWGTASAGPVEAPPSTAGDFLRTLKFDAELRARAEWTDNVRDFNNDLNASDDDGWLITRTRLGVAWQPIDWLKLYAQGQDSMELFSGRPHDTLRGANGNDHFDLRQAWLAIGDPEHSPVTLTLGRQPLDFGSRRILADPAWGNYGRSFDAGRLTWRVDRNWTVDAFAGNVVTIREDEFNTPDRASDLVGIFATGKFSSNRIVDLYAIHLDSEDSAIAPILGEFWTFGARLFRKPAPDTAWDYEFETVVQTGGVRHQSFYVDRDLFAYGGQATLGYTFTGAPWSPRLSLNYSYASGDTGSDSTQHRLQTVYPSTHPMNGLLDAIGWANLHDPYLELKFTPHEGWTFGTQCHAFFLGDDYDMVYQANGTSTAPNKPPNSFIGMELDLYVQANLGPELELLLGAGTLLANFGDTEDSPKNVYAQLTYKY